MPSAETFTIKPIKSLVKWYLSKSKISIDPFARNNRWATYTNDLNPETQAEFHLDAVEFLEMLKEQNIKADLGIFDPPYSPRQVQEVYQGIGRPVTQADTQMVNIRRDARNVLADLIEDGGRIISFGWNSAGIGLERNFVIEEILMVCHGGWHNDTIVTVERKQPQTMGLFN
jgi:hypothetical protein